MTGETQQPAPDLNPAQTLGAVDRLDPALDALIASDALSRPNGIAFSPDEKTLYVANSDPERPIWMAYDVQEDGTLSNDRIFLDAIHLTADKPGMPDGLKVGHQGNLFATGPGGVLVFSPDGNHLGTINTTVATANCAFGKHPLHHRRHVPPSHPSIDTRIKYCGTSALRSWCKVCVYRNSYRAGS